MPRAARSIAILLSLCLGAIAPLARAAPAAHAAPAATYTLDFCQPASWKSACELQAKHHARRDVFCSERLSPLRDALVSYCARHSAALRDVAEHGTTAAKKYRYVAAVYGHESGLGNRMPGMVSGLFLALMTDRIFIHDYKDYDKYFDSPVNFSRAAFLPDQAETRDFRIFAPFLEDEYRSVRRASALITEDLQAKYGHYAVWLTNGNADYPAATLQANPHFKAKLERLFPSYEVYWPLSLLLFRLQPRLQQQVEAFQRRQRWGTHTVIGVQVRTKKAPVSGDTLHRFADLAHALVVDARLAGKPVQVFITADSAAAYRDLRQRLKHVRDAAITTTDNEQLLQTTAETEAHNPGTEDSALLDMHLLKCAHAVIITSTSSFGWAAAGMGGLRAFYVAEHDKNHPSSTSAHPAFWRATSSEPCNSLGWWKDEYLRGEALALWREHPLHSQWRQCHTPLKPEVTLRHPRVEPRWPER